MKKLTFGLAIAAALSCSIPVVANAGLMTVTVSGTAFGTDLVGNSVVLGNTSAGNLNGMAASISITYDSALWMAAIDQPGGYFALHQPASPSFTGTVGNNPIRSASFTINGVTLGLDASGLGELGRLQVENNNNSGGGRDHFGLYGGDVRQSWCPNDGQCAERFQINLSGAAFQDLWGIDGFSPGDEIAIDSSSGADLFGAVRMYQNANCLPGSAFPSTANVCPAGRFSDGAVHYVDFQLFGTRLTIDAQEPGPTGVPEPASLWLALAGIGMLARRQGLGRQ